MNTLIVYFCFQESTYKSNGDKYSVVPYKKDDFNSLLELLQKDMDQVKMHNFYIV